MVDYKSITSVGTPAAEVIRIQILERRAVLIDAVGAYVKAKSGAGGQVNVNTYAIQYRAYELFLELSAILKRDLPDKEYDELLRQVTSNRYEDLLLAVERLNLFLYDKRITKIDTRTPYDTTRVLEEDAAYGV